jgi:hypothetical protein
VTLAVANACQLCEGTRKVQRRGYTTRCEPCDEREIRTLKEERDALRKVLAAARSYIKDGSGITDLVDAVIDYDAAK